MTTTMMMISVNLSQSSGVPARQPATVEPTTVPPPPSAHTSWERTAAADDLRRRQEELERKAADLERREQEMQRNLQLQGTKLNFYLLIFIDWRM